MKKINATALRGLFCAVLLSVSVLAWSQTRTSGAVVGTVTDSSGAVIVNAQVGLSDVASATKMAAKTNSSGQYIFPNVAPGQYQITIEAPGFRKAVVNLTVEVAKSERADVSLAVGPTAEAVQVSAERAADLQTLESSVGDVISSEQVIRMPTSQRNALELVYLQVGTLPATGLSAQYYGRGGSVSGVRGDQNTTTVDGIDASERYTSVSRGLSSIDLPVDAIEEFRSTTSNPNAQMGTTSSGGYYNFTTRRGTNNFHGSAYWYGQNDALNANSWTRNRLGQDKTPVRDNRFGGRFGGPIFKDKTYFFAFFEERRLPQMSEQTRIVPTDSMRQGILKFADNAGNIISYDLATSTLCGTAHTSACDPRHLGISPIVKQYFGYYPAGNDPSATGADGLNTIGYTDAADATSRSDTALFRLDHNISKNWRVAGSAIYQRQRLADVGDLEMDTRVTGGSGFKTLGGTPRDPRHIVLALTGQLTSNVNNEFRAGWNRQDFGTQAQLAQTQIEAAKVPIQLGQYANTSWYLGNLGDPASDVARPQYVKQRTWSFNDNLSWLHGSHLFQFGFSSGRQNFYNARTDRIPLNTVPAAQITAGFKTSVPTSQRPQRCPTTTSANCIPQSQEARWNGLYGALLGIWDNTQALVIRDPATGAPSGDRFAAASALSWHHEISVMDTWRVKPSLTLNLGLTTLIETPWADEKQREFFIANATSGGLIHPWAFIQQEEAAAAQGNVFNVPIEYLPRGKVGRAPYDTNFNVAPRISAAWSPSFSGGILGRMFGQRKSVLRGGYSLMFDRVMATGMITSQISANELLNSSATVIAPDCNAAGTPGAGCAAGVPFRLGVDGAPFAPTPAATVPVPYVPAARTATNSNFGVSAARAIDPDFKVGRVHGANLTFQRELPGTTIVEFGWIGRYGRELPVSFNLNAVPVNLVDMSHVSSQTFAQAYDALATELRSGVAATAVTPQPWFENGFGAGYTRTLAGAASSNITGGKIADLFTGTLDKKLLALGKPAVLNQQFDKMSYLSSGGWSNYDAVFVAVRKRTEHLTLNGNWTWSHFRDIGSNAADSNASAISNPFSPGFDYGDSLADIRHVWKFYGTYELPLPTKSKLLGGWYSSFIFIARTGVPIPMTEGGQIFGSPAIFGSTNESLPFSGAASLATGVNSGVAGSGGVATTGNPATGGTGLNLFANPEAVYDSFRPFLLSQDTRSNRGSVRGLGFWNLDFSFGKRTQFRDKLSASLSFDFFNVFNHVTFKDPSLAWTSPASFGVISAQAEGNPARADFSGPRRIQVGLRLEF